MRGALLFAAVLATDGFLSKCPCSECDAVPGVLLGKGAGLTCLGKEPACDESCAECHAGQSEGAPTCSAGVSLLQETAQTHCPPPQPCTCSCECSEILYPVPPPMPLLPTPQPHFGLLEVAHEALPPPLVDSGRAARQQEEAMLEASFVQTKAQTRTRVVAGSTQPVPGTTPALPGSPINLLPPMPMPPLPPMPPDLRIQDCPHNTPCTCYCHCKQPPEAATTQMFAPPELPPCQPFPHEKATPAEMEAAAPAPVTTTTTTTSTTTTTLGTTSTTTLPPCQVIVPNSLGPWAPGAMWGPALAPDPRLAELAAG